MRLLRIAIQNFRVIRKTDIVLPDRVIGIIGPNGAGKSSIVEAVAWALYGVRVARSGKEDIRSTYAALNADCEVCLEFELSGEHYNLTRRQVGRRERAEVTLYRNGDCESSGSTETERYVTQLLGLDWRGFLTSFLARQQELNALANLAPGRRREQLAGMLGIDRLDSALRLLKEDRRLLQQTALNYEGQVTHVDGLRKALVELGEHVRRFENQQDTLAGAYANARQKYQQTEQSYREHQTRQASCSQLQAQLDTVESTRSHLAGQFESLLSKEAELVKSRQEMNGFLDQLHGYEQFKAELADMEGTEERQARTEEMRKRLGAANRESSEIQETAEDLQAGLNSVKRELNKISRNPSAELEETAAQLEAERARWANTRADVTSNAKALEGLEQQLKAIDRVGPDAVCERCRRPFGDDLPQIKSHLEVELSESAAAGERLNQVMIDSQEAGEQLKKKVAELQGLVQRRRELELKHESQERESGSLAARLRSLTEQCAELDALLTKIEPVSFDPERLIVLKREVGELEQIKARTLILEGELKALPETRENILKCRDQLARAEQEAAGLKNQLVAVGFDADAMVRIGGELTKSQSALEEARAAHQDAAKELEISQREIKLKGEELGRLAETAARLEECRTDQFYAEKLVSLFGDFRKETISRIRPRLAELSSQLISEMSHSRYSLIDLDEDYNLQIMDGGQFFGVDRFSGGERDLASLCLRLAISLALTESAGLDRSFVILDEVFGSQDADRRDAIFQSLANLKERFPQIVLVTHLDELKHKVETLIELVPQPGGWSEVRVNGEVA